MASRVTFRLDELQKQAREAIQKQIDAKQQEIMRFEGFLQHYDSQVENWRTTQEEALFELNRSFEHMTPDAIANFRFEPVPKRDTYAVDRSRRELQRLEDIAVKIAAKAASLTADADGNISLTKIQLAEYFGL